MTLSYDIKVEGFEELGKKLEPDELLGDALKHVLGQASLTIERQAKLFSPVDTGRLRASVTSLVDSSPVPLWAKVDSDVEYAEEVNSPEWRGPRPGGVGRKQFFTRAIESTRARVDAILKEAERMIKERFER